jgi:AbrB family looped-hinge helix DNA binding protein
MYNFPTMDAVNMTTVRVREKRQITIPSDIGKLAGIEPNDLLEIEITSQGVLLRPVRTGMQDRVSKLMRFAGSGLSLVNPADPDETVRQLRDDRDAWTH